MPFLFTWWFWYVKLSFFSVFIHSSCDTLQNSSNACDRKPLKSDLGKYTGWCDQLTHGWIRIHTSFSGSHSPAPALYLPRSVSCQVTFSPMRQTASIWLRNWLTIGSRLPSFQPNTVERASVSQYPTWNILGFIPHSQSSQFSQDDF